MILKSGSWGFRLFEILLFKVWGLLNESVFLPSSNPKSVRLLNIKWQGFKKKVLKSCEMNWVKIRYIYMNKIKLFNFKNS